MKQLINHVPVPIAGVALGFTALGNLLQQYSEGVRLLCGGIAAVLILLLFARMITCFEEVKAEFKNPITAGVSATIFMTLMQLSTYAVPYIGSGAKVVWYAAVAAHLVLILWYTAKFMIRFRLEDVYPTCFIAYVGIVVASVTSGAFGMEKLGEVIFWFGFALYLVMLVLVTLRYIRYQVADSAKPLFCIYTAPMSLCLTGYITAAAVKSLPFMIVLEIGAQLLFLIVLTQLPKLLKLSFYPSYAAFTFPFVITAFGLKKLLAYVSGTGIAVPEAVTAVLFFETAAAAVMVFYALFRYLVYLSGFVKWGGQGDGEEGTEVSC